MNGGVVGEIRKSDLIFILTKLLLGQDESRGTREKATAVNQVAVEDEK